MTLRITLRDGEKMIVNGAVLRANGRLELIVENQVALLRGREVMAPDEATTSARRLYLACMMAYIDDAARDTHQDRIVELLGELLSAFETAAARMLCLEFAHCVATAEYYRALGICRRLIDYETAALDRLAGRAV